MSLEADDRDGELVDGPGGSHESVGVVIAAVAVVDDSDGYERLGPCIPAVEDLCEIRRGIAGCQAAGGDRWHAGGSGRAVVGLGVARRGDGDGKLTDGSGRGHEGVRVVVAAVAVVDECRAAIRVRGPASRLSKAWVKLAESPRPRPSVRRSAGRLRLWCRRRSWCRSPR